MFENEQSETPGESSHIDEDENKLAAVVESNIRFLFFHKHSYCVVNNIFLVL